MLRLTNVPILALKQDYQEKEIKNILIPLELYLSSRQKVADAIAWAKHYNAKITLYSGIWDKEKENYRKYLSLKINFMFIFIILTMNQLIKIKQRKRKETNFPNESPFLFKL